MSREYLTDTTTGLELKCENCRFFSVDFHHGIVFVDFTSGEVSVPGRCININKQYGPRFVWDSEPCRRTSLPRNSLSEYELKSNVVYGFIPKDGSLPGNNQD